MSATCQLTGRRPGFGRSVSHSHVRTSRRWNPNIQRRTYFVPSLGRRVALNLSTKASRSSTATASRALSHVCVPRGEVLMAARSEIRPVVKLRSTAGTGYTYVTRKNRRNDPDRLVLRKYDPVLRRHVDFREEK